MKTRKQAKGGGALRITPIEYFHHAMIGVTDYGFQSTRRLIVFGDIHLSQFEGGGFSLPAAEIRGDVKVDDCPGLRGCHLDVQGVLEIRGCPLLADLTGQARQVLLDGVGIESLGANFTASGDVQIYRAERLRKLNCQIGGNLTVDTGAPIIIGPAFVCKGFASLPAEGL